VDIVLPIYYGNYNEIEGSLRKVYYFLNKSFGNYSWNIIIGLNGPNKNGIFKLCKSLTEKYSHTCLRHTQSSGRGASLSDIWLNSNSDYVSFMDIDLSTDLKHFPLMIKELDNGCDVCVGSRYLMSSNTRRSFFRYFLSKVYNGFFTKFLLGTKFTDAQCGFKSARTDIAHKIIPLIKDSNWFWDTEFLYLSQRKGCNLVEIPVVWKEQPNSGVKFFRTIADFIVKSLELRFRKA